MSSRTNASGLNIAATSSNTLRKSNVSSPRKVSSLSNVQIEITNLEDDDEPLDLGLTPEQQEKAKFSITLTQSTLPLPRKDELKPVSPTGRSISSQSSYYDSDDEKKQQQPTTSIPDTSLNSPLSLTARSSELERKPTTDERNILTHRSQYNTSPDTPKLPSNRVKIETIQQVSNNAHNLSMFEEEDESGHVKDDPLSVNLKPSRQAYMGGSRSASNSDNISTTTSLVAPSQFAKDQAVLKDRSFCDMTDEELMAKQKRLLTRKNSTRQQSPSSANGDTLGELKNKMEFREEDMSIMNVIIDYAKKEEQKLLVKSGPFSTVSKYERESKRQEEKKNISKMLNDVKKRQTENDSENVPKKTPDNSLLHSNKKRKWIEESKKKSRENLKEHIWVQKMEDIALEARINHEKTVQEYKMNYDELFQEHQNVLQQIKVEKENVVKIQEENKSLKYTIDMLRQKLSKQSAREIEKEQRLRLFSRYEPLFETLQKNFNFDSPYDVIKRIEILEKAQTDSYTQLLEIQEQKSSIERQFEKFRSETEQKHRQALSDLERQIERDQNQIKEYAVNIRNLQQTLSQSENFRQKHLILSDAVIDLWHTWVKDVEAVGFRDGSKVSIKNGNYNISGAITTLQMLEEPDFSDSNQVLSSVKNLLIAFTPNKAGNAYTELARIANGLWLRYFKSDFEIKSKPKQIFERMAQHIDSRHARIKELERKLKETELSKKTFEEGMNKAVREKRAAEVQSDSKQSKRPQSASARFANNVSVISPTMNYIYGTATEQLESKTRQVIRPQSARTPSKIPRSPSTTARRDFVNPFSRSSSAASVYQTSKRPMSAPSTKRPSSSKQQLDEAKTFFITQQL